MVKRDPNCVNHEFFGDWIRGYSADEYHQANLDLMELTAKACEGCSEEQIDHLTEIGKRCSLYEGLFWDMAWELRR